MNETSTEARARVAQGMAFLNAHPAVPDNWRTLIDVSTLDISQYDLCVLGQLARHLPGGQADDYYGQAVVVLFPESDHYQEPRFHGFVGGAIDGTYVGWGTLNEAWKEALTA